MRSAYELPSLALSTSPPAQTDVDLLVLPFVEGGADALLAVLGPQARRDVSWAIERGSAKPEMGAVHVTTVADGDWRPRRVALVGIGSPTRANGREAVRRLASAAGLLARQQRVSRVGIALVLLGRTTGTMVAAAAEGVVGASFNHGHLKSRDELFWVRDVVLVASEADAALDTALHEGRVVGEAVNAARHLANEPGNRLPPQELAERAVTLLTGDSLKVRVIREDELASLGMGLLLGVGQGSDHPPRMVVCEYTPAEPPDPKAPVLGLVGKGITFDTGGVSIKPADGMGRMKDDMSGAAAVIGAMRAIGRLGAPNRVVAVMPMAENMLSGRAARPGDVLRGASGLTVEVINTDAEGRLILGDGLWFARQLGATHLVDIATLTGACVVALGMQITGLFARPTAWGDVVAAAADAAGETVWPMPVHEEYRELLKSDIADMINSPGRAAGAITAALFLEEFARGVPWTHLDIAGTAWTDEAKPWSTKGATGAMVGTLVALARGDARGWPS
jgi:leucyl aminopeptidase